MVHALKIDLPMDFPRTEHFAGGLVHTHGRRVSVETCSDGRRLGSSTQVCQGSRRAAAELLSPALGWWRCRASLQDCATLESFEAAAQVDALISAVLPESVSTVTLVLMAFRIAC